MSSLSFESLSLDDSTSPVENPALEEGWDTDLEVNGNIFGHLLPNAGA